MKILHTADIHLGDLNGPIINGKNARREDTINCMKAIATRAKEDYLNGQRAQVAIIAGDLFNRSRVWADTALEDITDAIEELIHPLCIYCEEVVLLFGTENHDNPRAFEVLNQTTSNHANLSIITKPEVFTLSTTAGNIQILGLPGFDKGRLRTFMPDADKEAENRNATAMINDVLLGLSTRLDKNIPSILVAHYTVAGSENESGSTFMAGQDVVILPQMIDASGVTLATLGHIHKPQRLNTVTPAFYCGSINQLTFNDEPYEHGFYVHHIEQNEYIKSDWFPTPERKHLTLKMNEESIAIFNATSAIEGLADDIKGTIVRVRYEATEEQDKALNKALLQKRLLEAGAFHVAEIIALDKALAETTAEDLRDETPVETLERYLDITNTSDDIKKELIELALPLFRKADDGREESKHTGAFTPKRIEVSNYRSYTDAAFNFDDIHMAMVNGKNGVGKSSLFMDAIADCLFEESRDESLGGWIREGEKKGAICFEFSMGDKEYRVVRTRLKSGKATLAFNVKEDGNWTDCGDTTMKLTQAKIEQVLGMDYQTFGSVALIRQDAYGIFLDADSTRRMEVLSALLGLGLYNRLEDLAKQEASEKRKELASAKERMAIFADEMAKEESLKLALANNQIDITTIGQEVAAYNEALSSAEREEALRQEVLNQIREKEEQSQKLQKDIEIKEQTKNSLEVELKQAEDLANILPQAEQADREVKEARARLEELSPIEAEIKALEVKLEHAKTAIRDGEIKLKNIETDKAKYQSIISRKDEIEKAASDMKQAEEELVRLEEEKDKYLEAIEKLAAAEKERDLFIANINIKNKELEVKLSEAKSKTKILSISNCPIIENASCNFLKDAMSAKNAIAELEQNLDELHAENRAKLQGYEDTISLAQTELTAINDPAQSIENNKRIILTARPIAELITRLATAEDNLSKLNKDEEEINANIQKNNAEQDQLQAKLEELKASTIEADTLRTLVKNKELTASLLPRCTAGAAKVEGLIARIKDFENEIITSNEALMKLNIDVTAIKVTLPETTKNLQEIKTKLEDANERLSAKHANMGAITTKLEAVKEAGEQYRNYASKVSEISKKLNSYQALAQAFGIDGVQYMIVKSIIPEITSKANDILAAMTGGRMAIDIRTEKEQKSTQKIVNSLDVWINNLSGLSRPYSSHSGGEKVKIALATTLALADVKARRAGVQLGMLFIDEPPFLDADGTEAYSGALTNMSHRNPDMRILAISHDQAMKARFEQNIIVTETESGSKVELE